MAAGETRLELARGHVREAEQRIDVQRELVRELSRKRLATRDAEELELSRNSAELLFIFSTRNRSRRHPKSKRLGAFSIPTVRVVRSDSLSLRLSYSPR